MHTAIETAGNVPWRFMEQVLPHGDLMLHDNKLMDSERHKKWVGGRRTLNYWHIFRPSSTRLSPIAWHRQVPVGPSADRTSRHEGCQFKEQAGVILC